MRTTNIRKLAIVLPFIFTAIGCVEESRSVPVKAAPSTSEIRAIAHQNAIFDRAEAEYAENLLSREKNKEIERETRAHNLEYYRTQQANAETCFVACQEENEARKLKQTQLQATRDTVRRTCKTTGTHFQGRPDLVETDEDSPTAHPRIVEENGKLVYLERRIDVVEIGPKWICPNEAGEDIREVASKWMRDTPPEFHQRPCSSIKDGTSMRNIALDVCLRWVKAPGGG